MQRKVEHPAGWKLVDEGGRLELRSMAKGGPGAIYVDFVRGPMGYERVHPGTRLLYRAVGVRGGRLPEVVDATAGLGRDAFVLAWRGCRVRAVERSPMIAALLEDGIRRAMEQPEIAVRLEGRLELVRGDAKEFLKGLGEAERPDVVCVDPMFPPRSKAAKVKKESVALREVVGQDADAGELLEVARRAARWHVVVKRMVDSPPIVPGVVRTYEGKSTRFDVYEPTSVERQGT